MPLFPDLAEADRWRAVHAPPRGRRLTGKNRDEQTPQPPTGEAGGGQTNNDGTGGQSSPSNKSGGEPRDKIDIKRFIRRVDDFDGLALRQAEETLQIAFGLYRRAAEGGDAVEVAAALKNYNDAAKACASAREKFLETREKSRALISLDEVEDVVGTELQEVRNRLLKLDDRVAAELTAHFPTEQLQLVKTTIAAAVDAVFQRIDALPVSSRRQLEA